MSNVIHTDTSQSDFQNGVLTDVIATADGILELGDINYSLAGGINLNEVSQEVYKEYCSGLDTYKWYQYGFCISPDGKRMITVSRTLDNTCAAEYGYIRKWEFIDSYDNWQPSNLYYATDTDVTRILEDGNESPHDIFFGDDGYKLYVIDYYREIYSYNLSTAYDFTQYMGFSYNNYFNLSNINSKFTDLQGGAMNSDGTKLYVVTNKYNDKGVYEFDLSTAWDVTTISYNSVSMSLPAGEDYTGLEFSPDGKKMFLLDHDNKNIEEYNLSTAWDLSTASYNTVKNSYQESDEIAWGHDGTKLFELSRSSGYIYEHHLTGYAGAGNLISDEISLNGVEYCSESSITYNATLNGQSIDIETNVSYDSGTTWQGWKSYTGGNITDLTIGNDLSTTKIIYKVILSTNDNTKTPVLEDITITVYDNQDPTITIIDEEYPDIIFSATDIDGYVESTEVYLKSATAGSYTLMQTYDQSESESNMTYSLNVLNMDIGNNYLKIVALDNADGVQETILTFAVNNMYLADEKPTGEINIGNMEIGAIGNTNYFVNGINSGKSSGDKYKLIIEFADNYDFVDSELYETSFVSSQEKLTINRVVKNVGNYYINITGVNESGNLYSLSFDFTAINVLHFIDTPNVTTSGPKATHVTVYSKETDVEHTANLSGIPSDEIIERFVEIEKGDATVCQEVAEALLDKWGVEQVSISGKIDMTVTLDFKKEIRFVIPEANIYELAKIEDIDNATADFNEGTLSDVVAENNSLILDGTTTTITDDESFETDLGSWLNDASNDLDWQRNSGSTPSSSTGPSSALDGSYYIYIETSSSNSGDISIVEYDMGSLGDGEIDFYYHQYGTDQGTLYLEGWDGSSWVVIWSSTGDQGSSWININQTFTGYSKIRFRNVAVGGYRGDVALDLISLSYDESEYVSSGYRVININLSNISEVTGSNIEWTATIPTNTNLTIESSVDGGSWQECVNGSSIPDLLSDSESIEIKQTLETTDAGYTPSLDSLEVIINSSDIAGKPMQLQQKHHDIINQFTTIKAGDIILSDNELLARILDDLD